MSVRVTSRRARGSLGARSIGSSPPRTTAQERRFWRSLAFRPVAKRTSSELVREAHGSFARARDLVALGDLKGAAESARHGFSVARAQGSHQLVSEAWIGLIETLAAGPDNDLSPSYATEAGYALDLDRGRRFTRPRQ